MNDCQHCNGTGSVDWGMVPSIGGIGGYIMETRPCGACDGTGVHVECRECLDCGEVATERNPDGTWNLGGAYGPCNCAAGRRVQAGEIVTAAGVVTAPGFTERQFVTALQRGLASQLRTSPASTPGTVMVHSASGPAVYAVTRQDCSCAGGRSHGYCKHRAYLIWLADVRGLNPCHVTTIGVNTVGVPVQAAA